MQLHMYKKFTKVVPICQNGGRGQNDLAWRCTYSIIYLKNACFNRILGLAMPLILKRSFHVIESESEKNH